MNEPPFDRARDAGSRLHRFHGGLRLRHHKMISCRHPVERPPLPDKLVVPLLQHIGVPAKCTVSVGDRVLKGERIAGRAAGFGAHVHAPTSGTVVALEHRPMAHPSGRSGPCIVIEPDGEERWIETGAVGNWQEATPETLREAILGAGIVGLGGAVFPTARKVESAHAARIHTLIINGAECEPYISCDEMLMRERAGRVVLGSRILERAVGAQRSVIAIEDQMGAVRDSLVSAVRDQHAESVSVVRIQTIYPEGGERQLVQVLTGLEVPENGLPQDLGLLCQNVGTAAATADAVVDGRPLIERYVTVTGHGVHEPRNWLALIGTPVGHLVAAGGGYRENAARLVVGGPMMGYAIASDAEPVVKASNCILVLDEADIAETQPEVACIRCGECSRVCPARLMPQDLNFWVRSEQWDQAREWGLEACIECGCCDYVCPSHIPLAQWFRYGKGVLRERDIERAFAEHSRRRHEAREERLEREQRERADRLARRKQALKGARAGRAAVAAAIERAEGRVEPDEGDKGAS